MSAEIARGTGLSRGLVMIVSTVAGAMVWFSSGVADAQIKQPGAHPRYSVELEPHLLFHHAGYGWYDDGWGLGLRASIPIVEDGPIKTINNSMAIGFGLDWAHFGGHCWSYYWGRPRPVPGDQYYGYWDNDCDANELWFPVTLQWNFWLTDVISVFGEPGLAIVRRSWEFYAPCPEGWCKRKESDTDFEPIIFFAGARFLVSENIGITVRLGWPYLSAGASFLF